MQLLRGGYSGVSAHRQESATQFRMPLSHVHDTRTSSGTSLAEHSVEEPELAGSSRQWIVIARRLRVIVIAVFIEMMFTALNFLHGGAR